MVRSGKKVRAALRLVPELAAVADSNAREKIFYAVLSANSVYWAFAIRAAVLTIIAATIQKLLQTRGYLDGDGARLIYKSCAILLAMIVSLWLVRNRIRKGVRARLAELGIMRCRGCGYDLSGNTALRCPECGSELLIQQLRAIRLQDQKTGQV